ncbi:anticodon nuclease [Acetobacteraceae bacterium]|nr:anticodon nuclease [Acetobacteraceae bacterium]
MFENALHEIKKKMTSKVTLLYAFNGTGKTQLSKLFYEDRPEETLYYNAFTEDLFHWDNEQSLLGFNKSSWLLKTIEEQGLENRISKNFKSIITSKLEPSFNFLEGHVSFDFNTGDDTASQSIKISRGEESVFIWSIFYTLLENLEESQKEDEVFKKIKYILIDDPVSSMDEGRIITIALKLSALIKKTKSLKFLISTHHPLFFNILYAEHGAKEHAFICTRENNAINFIAQKNDSPFLYHHAILLEIEKAILQDNLKKYHFNLFRTLLEKTANFLGHDRWKTLLSESSSDKIQQLEITKRINHHSHGSLSESETDFLSPEDREIFTNAFNHFIQKFHYSSFKKAS